MYIAHVIVPNLEYPITPFSCILGHAKPDIQQLEAGDTSWNINLAPAPWQQDQWFTKQKNDNNDQIGSKIFQLL